MTESEFNAYEDKVNRSYAAGAIDSSQRDDAISKARWNVTTPNVQRLEQTPGIDPQTKNLLSAIFSVVFAAIGELIQLVVKFNIKGLAVWAVIFLALHQFPYLTQGDRGHVLTFFCVMLGLLVTGPNARRIGIIGLAVPLTLYIGSCIFVSHAPEPPHPAIPTQAPIHQSHKAAP